MPTLDRIQASVSFSVVNILSPANLRTIFLCVNII